MLLLTFLCGELIVAVLKTEGTESGCFSKSSLLPKIFKKGVIIEIYLVYTTKSLRNAVYQ